MASELADVIDLIAVRENVPPAANARCQCGLGTNFRSVACYVGPEYAQAVRRIMFVGLDSGQGWWKRLANAREVQSELVAKFRDGGVRWNPHYAGCVRVAASVLGLGCGSTCKEKCRKKTSSECALLCFSQANAVRCVHSNERNSDCRSQERVKNCLPFLFKEIGVLKPDVIVLQGRNKRSGHLQVSFRNEIERGLWGQFEGQEHAHVQTIRWFKYDGWTGPTQLASLYHPSARGRFAFDKIWRSHFGPAITRIRDGIYLS